MRPTQPQVSLSMVLNPLLLQRLVGCCLSIGLHQRVPHFFFFFSNRKCLIYFTISGQTHCD